MAAATRNRDWLAQLGLERLDLRSQVLHLLRLGCNDLGLLCEQVFDGRDLALDGVRGQRVALH